MGLIVNIVFFIIFFPADRFLFHEQGFQVDSKLFQNFLGILSSWGF